MFELQSDDSLLDIAVNREPFESNHDVTVSKSGDRSDGSIHSDTKNFNVDKGNNAKIISLKDFGANVSPSDFACSSQEQVQPCDTNFSNPEEDKLTEDQTDDEYSEKSKEVYRSQSNWSVNKFESSERNSDRSYKVKFCHMCGASRLPLDNVRFCVICGNRLLVF
ncbi:hypothetical protein ACOME3_002954 [Neoechinorhynchus agilis]